MEKRGRRVVVMMMTVDACEYLVVIVVVFRCFSPSSAVE